MNIVDNFDVSLLKNPPEQKDMVRAGLQEVFSSIQGEGPYVGRRQVFVRFNACHLACVYCDTPQRPASETCQVETAPGSSSFVYLPNPVSVEEVFLWVQRLCEQVPHHSISFTGGEPLLYTSFLKALLPLVSPLMPVYLETSGTQPDKLREILPWVDIIAMDIKLPSATGEAMQVENHREFYSLCLEKERYVKLVFSESTTFEELAAVSSIVSDPSEVIVLQPVTDLVTGENTVSISKIFEVDAFMRRAFSDVRVIPQTHKMLGLL